MTLVEWLVLGLVALITHWFAWLYGYRCGWEAMRTRAIQALRFSARLRRGNKLHPGSDQEQARAEALEHTADRFAGPLWRMDHRRPRL